MWRVMRAKPRRVKKMAAAASAAACRFLASHPDQPDVAPQAVRQFGKVMADAVREQRAIDGAGQFGRQLPQPRYAGAPGAAMRCGMDHDEGSPVDYISLYTCVYRISRALVNFGCTR